MQYFEIKNPNNNYFSLKVISNFKSLNIVKCFNSKFLDRLTYTCSGTSSPTDVLYFKTFYITSVIFLQSYIAHSPAPVSGIRYSIPYAKLGKKLQI